MSETAGMLEETARVIEVKDGWLIAETASRSSCSHCGAGSCSTSVVAKLFGLRHNRLLIDNTLGARVGDEVVVGIPDQVLVSASLLAYLLPLVVMLCVTAVGDRLGMNEFALSLLAPSGLALGFFTVRWHLRRNASQRYEPRLVRIVAPGYRRVELPTMTSRN